MAVTIRLLDDAARPAWDAFVKATPSATFFHLSPWEGVIARAFGHATHYLYAEQDGAIVGVLPLVRMRTRLFGDTLSSTPFCVYGGPAAATEEARDALADAAEALRAKLRAPALECRERDAPIPGWVTRSPLYFTFRKPIAFTGDLDKDLVRNLPVKRRPDIRKALKAGFTSVANTDTATHFRVYSESLRNHGTPAFPRRYFELLVAAFPGALDITTVLADGAPVSTMMSFHFRNEVLPYYGGGTWSARALRVNPFMFWEVMRRAALERGATLYDIGRSKAGTGSFDFKTDWGFTPQPLHYCYRLAPGASVPENNPNNPKYKAMIALWKRLPIPVANLLGPPIVRGLG
jgi:FemAB-related protein (PEP-CTERM system-associated)